LEFYLNSLPKIEAALRSLGLAGFHLKTISEERLV